jgi:hypothetical protein
MIMGLARSMSWNGTTREGVVSDVKEGTHLALQVLRLGTTLRNALVSLAPFLAHDNIVFLELLDRFETRSALVLNSLLGAFDSLERVMQSELHILKNKTNA